MKIIFIGSSAPLSLIPLNALIKSKHNVCAVAVDDDSISDINVITSESIQSLVLKNSTPLIKINKTGINAVSQIQAYLPDIILVSCYARKLPANILNIPRLGCFNLHPSLLPAFRGPTPLFWQFREGVKKFGVTLHRMNSEFDAGNILSQKSIRLPDGVSVNKATLLLATEASELILTVLDNIENCTITEVSQDEHSSSYQSFPDEEDYFVSVSWSAKRIFNFINAVKEPGIHFLCDIDGKMVKLIDAISYQLVPYDGMSGKNVIEEGEELKLACQTGYIHCRFKN